jgi:hypothetical protein
MDGTNSSGMFDSSVLIQGIWLAAVIELIFKRLDQKRKAISFSIVFAVTLMFVFFTSEEGVFNREENMFEVLKVEPFASKEDISRQIETIFPKRDTEYHKEFEYLIQKNFHDQYYKFGSIRKDQSPNDVDERHVAMLTKYIIFIIIALIFMGDELPQAKRICFIFTVLAIFYEGGLYFNIDEKDFLLGMFPKHYCLFEIIKFFHWLYTFIYLLVVGLGAIHSLPEDMLEETEKNKLLCDVMKNQATIRKLIGKLDDQRKELEKQDENRE